jgi:hypothetical protein
VYLRLAADDSTPASQYAGVVMSTDGSRVLLFMPLSWWSKLA